MPRCPQQLNPSRARPRPLVGLAPAGGLEGRLPLPSVHSRPWGAHLGLPLCLEGYPSFRCCPGNVPFLPSLFRAALSCSLLGSAPCKTSGKPLLGPGRASALPARTDRPIFCHPDFYPTHTHAAMRPCRRGRLPDPPTLTQVPPLPRGCPEAFLSMRAACLFWERDKKAHNPSRKNQGLGFRESQGSLYS